MTRERAIVLTTIGNLASVTAYHRPATAPVNRVVALQDSGCTRNIQQIWPGIGRIRLWGAGPAIGYPGIAGIYIQAEVI